MQLLDIVEPEVAVKSVAFGIDLGTTNSLISMVEDDGSVMVFKDASGRVLVPSVVEYCDSDVRVGHDVDINSPRALRSIKRLMGRDVCVDASGLVARDAMSDDGGGSILGATDDAGVTPVEVSAEILRKLCCIVKESVGIEVTKAVITVPAYFDEVARKATRDAARLAGIEVLRLLNEPTASVLAYKVEQASEAGIYVVYDFGGGTFDVSVVKLHSGVFQVLATGGDIHLGGDDIDRAIATLILRKYRDNNLAVGDGDFSSLSGLPSHLVLEARGVKESLSSGSYGEFTVEMQGERFVCSISEEEFDAVVAQIVEKTVSIVKDTVLDSGVTYEEISKVLLVGGSVKIPNVKSALSAIFHDKVFDDIDPEKAVVTGAALQAYYLSNPSAIGRKVLIDVVPLSLALETMGGIAEKIIPRNTPIPASITQEFTTYVDGQSSIHIHVCQGEREMAAENRSLARFDIAVPPLSAGEARIQVEFRVDMDGLLVVSARGELTGIEKCVEVHSACSVADTEVERQVVESVKNFDADMKLRDLSESRIEGQRILDLVKKELGESACCFSADGLKVVNDAFLKAESLLLGADADRMRDAVNELRLRFVSLKNGDF